MDVRLGGLKCWRRGSESNRRIKVLQTSPLPLGYRAPVQIIHVPGRKTASAEHEPFGKQAILEPETDSDLGKVELPSPSKNLTIFQSPCNSPEERHER